MEVERDARSPPRKCDILNGEGWIVERRELTTWIQPRIGNPRLLWEATFTARHGRDFSAILCRHRSGGEEGYSFE
jgi:hypothetical protein